MRQDNRSSRRSCSHRAVLFCDTAKHYGSRGLKVCPLSFTDTFYSAVIPSPDLAFAALGLMPLMGSTTLTTVPSLSAPISN